MRYISHRGNVDGVCLELENRPEYIDAAISLGYDVEIDLRTSNGCLYLGHDEPQYPISLEWMHNRRNNLWVHVKDYDSLNTISKTSLQYFCHKSDPYTITSNGYIWSHDFHNKMNNMCIVPLISREEVQQYNQYDFFAVCSDYILDCEAKFKRGIML